MGRNEEMEIAHLSAATCHFANISYRVGRMLTLDDGAGRRRTRRRVFDQTWVPRNRSVAPERR